MSKVTFFPLGNADSILIDLNDGRKLLFDYANVYNSEDSTDKRIDLEKTLREDLSKSKRNYYDVVAFTHADKDHIYKASEFFYFEHAAKYQDDDRIKINDLWVPAAFILETGLKDDARIIQAEARHRFKEGKGIRVFSRPDALKDWLEENGLSVESRKKLISNAGELIPGFTPENGSSQIFVHSPFAIREDSKLIDRNRNSIVVQFTFFEKDRKIRCILGADTDYENWGYIVNITKRNSREERLKWDIFKLSHHCSYKSLSDEKGKKETKPTDEIEWLWNQGTDHGIIVSTSNVIDEKDTNDPPHFQAANFYRKKEKQINGYFKVTMEYPNKDNPKKLVVNIDEHGATIEKKEKVGISSILTRRAPRAGC